MIPLGAEASIWMLLHFVLQLYSNAQHNPNEEHLTLLYLKLCLLVPYDVSVVNFIASSSGKKKELTGAKKVGSIQK